MVYGSWLKMLVRNLKGPEFYVCCFLAIVCNGNNSAGVFFMQVDHYIHRILVEEDVTGSKSNRDLFEVSTDAGENFYKKGDFAKSQISNIDDYLLRKVQKIF